MEITSKEWKKYIEELDKVNSTAAELLEQWVATNGIDNRDALIDYAYYLATKYGEASATLACEMFDATALAEGITTSALPADTASIKDVAKAVNGSIKQSPDGNLVSSTIYRLCKQAGADTTLQNAQKYGAQYAWIPAGDTCAYCLTLAARGWQYMSKEAMKNGHAEHIHANCDCQYAIRFNPKDTVQGYDPDRYKKMYYDAPLNGAKPTAKNRLNALRRELST